jgi:hypothetical protein
MNSVAIFSFNSSAHALEKMSLHDATLHSITMHWPSGEVEVSMFLVGGIRATLAFQAVTSVVLPGSQPWGRSNSINRSRTLSDGLYELEMQSIAAVPADA